MFVMVLRLIPAYVSHSRLAQPLVLRQIASFASFDYVVALVGRQASPASCSCCVETSGAAHWCNSTLAWSISYSLTGSMATSLLVEGARDTVAR